jgi:hypothetical protein
VDRGVVRRPIAAPRRGISRNAPGSFAQDPENSSGKSSHARLAYLLPQGAYCKNARKEAKGDQQWKLELNPIPIINCAKP